MANRRPRCRWFGCTERDGLLSEEVPICTLHAEQISDALKSKKADELAALAPQYKPKEYWGPPSLKQIQREFWEPNHPGDVYYLLIDGQIKIGWSKDVYTRLNSYPPHAHLLGTEPGDQTLERQRHQQFHAYLAYGREWFADTPEIRDHIATLPPSFYSDYKRMRRGAGNQPATVKTRTQRWQ